MIRDFLFLIVMNINLPSPVLPEGSLVTFSYVLPQTNLAGKQTQTEGLVTAIRKELPGLNLSEAFVFIYLRRNFSHHSAQ